MARLLIKTAGLENQTLELRFGVNHVGRDPACDFTIAHPSVSALHCELVLSNDGVLIHDCDSTNGTFVNGQSVQEAWLRPGQKVQLGQVILFVENTDIVIAIPQYEHERPKPPVLLPDGAMLCPRHPETQAIYKCTHCGEVMCRSCVHMVRRRGGQPLFLCLFCSHPCESISSGEKPQKKPAPQSLQRTVKLRLANLLGLSQTKK
ncbi:MAG: FHA domain-containing protein [Verrucomicrobiota bacterium]